MFLSPGAAADDESTKIFAKVLSVLGRRQSLATGTGIDVGGVG